MVKSSGNSSALAGWKGRRQGINADLDPLKGAKGRPEVCWSSHGGGRRVGGRQRGGLSLGLGSWVSGLGDAHNFHLTAPARAKPLKSWPLLSRHFSQVRKSAGKGLQTNCFQAMKADLSLLSPYRGMGHAERAMGRSRGEAGRKSLQRNVSLPHPRSPRLQSKPHPRPKLTSMRDRLP